MIFVSERPGGFGSMDLWISYNFGGSWQSPVNLGNAVNTPFMESAPYLAPGDSVLYFSSSATGGHGSLDVYRCPLNMGIPGPKENLPAPVNGGAHDCCPVISNDGERFYICSDRAGGFGSMDVWAFERSGEAWINPRNLGPQVNSSATDCPRWISDDGQTLALVTTRAGGYGGADLWFTEWNGQVWSAPINMGSVINTATDELGPDFQDNMRAIGGTIYFGSARPGGVGGRDIWMAVESTTSVSGAPAVGEPLVRIYPNPRVSATTIAYDLPSRARVTIDIYDVQGRHIRSLRDLVQDGGAYRLVWDGTTGTGEQVAAGVYPCRIRLGDREIKQKIVTTGN
jgi:hypothetical protein